MSHVPNLRAREKHRANIEVGMAQLHALPKASDPVCACGSLGKWAVSLWRGTTFYCDGCLHKEPF